MIQKRDGSLEQFDIDKIKNAVLKAFNSVNSSIDVRDCSRVFDEKIFSDLKTVEEIQDKVEQVLMENGYYDVAKSYILYRKHRENIRNSKTHLTKTFNDMLNVNATDNDLMRENANIDGNAPMGLMLLFGSETSKDYTKRYLLNPNHAQLHENADFHIHDLNMYPCTFNCCHIDLENLFKNGFSTGHGSIRKPQTIQTASALSAIVIQSNQNDMFGGQSLPMFEYNLAPYVAKSFQKRLKECVDLSLGVALSDKSLGYLDELYNNKGSVLDNIDDVKLYFHSLLKDRTDYVINKAVELTEHDVYQSMEAFIHNMNTLHSRAGSQTPFSSINYGTGTTAEQRMIIKNVLIATENGMGNHETPIFPIQVFKIKEGVNANPEDPNYDLFKLACRVTSKRLYPNYVNIDVPFNLQYYVPGKPETEMATMGALTGKSVLHVDARGISMDIPFKNLETWLLDNGLTTTNKPKQFDENTYYYDLTLDVYTNDSLSENGKTRIKRFMVFQDPKLKWLMIKFNVTMYSLNHEPKSTYSDYIIVTDDHPLPLVNKFGNLERTRADKICTGDMLVHTGNPYQYECEVCEIKELDEQYTGYDIETSTDRFDTESIVSHNCRTRVIGQLGTNEGCVANRGNIAFNTINLPRLAIKSKGDIQKFIESFDNLIDESIEELLNRVKFLCKKKVYNFPFLMGQKIYKGSENLEWDDSIEPALRNGTLSVGFVGLAECLVALVGKHHGESKQSLDLGLQIVQHLRDRMDQATKETGWNFSCFATPAESTAGRFVKSDKKKYGVIKGVTDRDYYTNSFHVPVYYPIKAHEKMEIEGKFHSICNAGAISYIELDGDPSQNISVVEKLVQYSRRCGISYFSLNFELDTCPVCGYTGVIKSNVCPNCGWVEGTDCFMKTRCDC